MNIEQSQVVGGYSPNSVSPIALSMDENGAIMTGSSRLQRRHFTSGTITYFAEAPLGTPLTSPGWRCWKLDTATGSDIEFAIGSTGLPSDSFEFIATDAILPLHNYGFVSDIVAPTLSTVTMASNNTVTTSAKIGDIATLTIVSNEEIRTPTVTIAGRSATVIAGVDALHWTATQTLISGDTEGLLALSVAFSDVGGTAGVTVTALTGGSGVTFDKTAPTALLEYSIDAGANYTTSAIVNDADTLRIRATFSEVMRDAPAVKIAIDNAVLSATAMTKTDTTHYYYDLNVPVGNIAIATCSLSVGLDTAGNTITAVPTANATFEIDNTLAVFAGVSVLSNNADTARAKSGDIVTATFTTTETLEANPTVTFGAQAMAFVSLTTGTYIYTRTLNGTETEGTANVLVTGTDIAGNTTTNTNVGNITTDFTAPTGTTVTMASNNADTTKAKTGEVITLTIITDENVGTPVATLDGSAMVIVPGVDAQHWTATYTMLTGDTEGLLAFTLDFNDITGNPAVQIVAVTGGVAVTFDKTLPTLSSVVDNSVTELKVTLSELALASTITKANDGGFVVYETGTPATTYAVTAINPGITDDLVVLTVADMTASVLVGVTVTYATGVNGTVSDLTGNLLATDAVGVATGAF